MRLVNSSILASLLLLLAGNAHAVVCRVTAAATATYNSGGGGGGDGSDWTAQAMALQAALGDDGNCSEIRAAAGVYKPGAAGDTGASFQINRDGRKLYGGFAGIAGEALEDRDPAANVTILSGDIDDNDINTDGNFIAETSADIVGSNSNHVLYIYGTAVSPYTSITANTVVSGFTITAGDAVGTSGGGLVCVGDVSHNCDPTLSHLHFRGNRAGSGGAMICSGIGSPMFYQSQCNLTLSHASFSGNHASGNGGALYNAGNFQPVLTNITFSGNSAGSNGGAIYNYSSWDNLGNSSPTLIGVTFSGNSADGLAGAIYTEGFNVGVNPVLKNVIVWGNGDDAIQNQNASISIDDSVVEDGCTAASSTCSNIITDDPLLGSLQDNGGGTLTMKPGVGSPAIDAGDDASCPDDDQRGVPRPQGAQCDIGALEGIVPLMLDVRTRGSGSVSADTRPFSASGLILDCSSSDPSRCAADYPELSIVRLLLTPEPGWIVDSARGCGGGLAGSVYTSDPMSTDCTVKATFIQQFTVTPVIGVGNGSISPDTPQTVDQGWTTDFLITPDSGWVIDSITTDSCDGSLNGNTYTTAPVNTNCTVTVNFVQQFTVTPLVGAGNGSISPDTPQLVNTGATTDFTLTPDPGWVIDTVNTNGCDGVLAGDVYTTSAIAADCTVSARFTQNPDVFADGFE